MSFLPKNVDVRNFLLNIDNGFNYAQVLSRQVGLPSTQVGLLCRSFTSVGLLDRCDSKKGIRVYYSLTLDAREKYCIPSM